MKYYMKICHEHLKCFYLLNLFNTDKKCQSFYGDQERKEISQISECEKNNRSRKGEGSASERDAEICERPSRPHLANSRVGMPLC